MAVDKLVDSAQLDSDLTSIANAIRTKGGTSAALAFPAGFMSAIGDIPTGGGGLAYDTGTFTVSSDKNADFTVSHGLGKAPDVVIVWTEDYDDSHLPQYDDTTAVGFIYLKRIIDMAQQLSTTNKTANSFYVVLIVAGGKDKIHITTPGVANLSYNTAPTASVFTVKKVNATYYRSGITYKYFVSEKWWT